MKSNLHTDRGQPTKQAVLKLRRLEEKSKAAREAVVAHLKALYPVGTEWGVMLSGRQVNPTHMKVTGHSAMYGWGMVSFEMPKPNRRFDWEMTRRDIAPSKILYCLS
jgi:hypothetical protein